MLRGDPVRGSLHSTDASLGVEIPIYSSGNATARTLGSTERLTIVSVQVVNVTAGDVHVFINNDTTPDAGDTVVRGTVAANAIMAMGFNEGMTGPAGQKPYVIAPAGVVDVVFSGFITAA